MSLIQHALLSVAEKEGLLPFARYLVERGVRLLSSGGTAKMLQESGVPVHTIEAYTESPEVMSGRVKTLHPRVHGGILARGEEDSAALLQLGGKRIDLVVVNLYPFEKVALRSDSSYEDLIEHIDIGGSALLRSAAKNHARVTVLCDPSDYALVQEEITHHGEVRSNTRRSLAIKAFAHTATYDTLIHRHLAARCEEASMCNAFYKDDTSLFPHTLSLSFARAATLRYGENPHQKGAFYTDVYAPAGTLARAKSLGSDNKALSFNNLMDADAALDTVRTVCKKDANKIYDGMPGVVIVKHTNPCGVALASTLAEAYMRARAADAVSAFGGIVACSCEVDQEAAQSMFEDFLECVVAPSFSEAALMILRAKKNLRLLATGEISRISHASSSLLLRQISGGLLVQTQDDTAHAEVSCGKVVTKRAPSWEEIRDLAFAWSVAKHVKSNAIVLANNLCTVGIGAGQMSRVISVEIACTKAGSSARGAVLASDAFFPFPDGLELAAQAGIRAVVQPGGSRKDEEVIAAADEHGLAMILTSVRHFLH